MAPHETPWGIYPTPSTDPMVPHVARRDTCRTPRDPDPMVPHGVHIPSPWGPMVRHGKPHRALWGTHATSWEIPWVSNGAQWGRLRTPRDTLCDPMGSQQYFCSRIVVSKHGRGGISTPWGAMGHHGVPWDQMSTPWVSHGMG